MKNAGEPWLDRSLAPGRSRQISRTMARALSRAPAIGSLGGFGAAALEPGHELVEPQLLEPPAHRLELGGADLPVPAPLLAELERLAQAGLARVQPGDDRLEPLAGGLVGECDVGLGHRQSQGTRDADGSGRPGRRPSCRRSVRAGCARAAAALVTGSPVASSTSA